MDDALRGNFSKYNELFHARKMSAFWMHVRRSRRCNVNSKLDVGSFRTFYHDIMTDKGGLSEEQSKLAAEVDSWESEYSMREPSPTCISGAQISLLIDSLNANCAPGIDGITSEHLKHGKSETL